MDNFLAEDGGREFTIRRRAYRNRFGRMVLSKAWSVSLSHEGRTAWISLGTGGKIFAEKRAHILRSVLVARGWEAVLAKCHWRKKRPTEVTAKKRKQGPGSIGEYLRKVGETGLIGGETFAEYVRNFNRILLDLFRPTVSLRRRERAEAIDYVHSLPLAKVSGKLIESWLGKVLGGENGVHPVSKTTINTRMRCAKALFSAKIRRAVGCVIPSPFEGVAFLREKSHRYVSRFDGRSLLAGAAGKLERPEYIVLVLALCAGLRRNEIDKLLWEQVDMERGIISIYGTPHFSPKSVESCSSIPLDAKVLELLREWRGTVEGEFVIPSTVASGVKVRCDGIFRRLAEWLREHGVEARCPIHTLRKEYGAEICRKFGLYAASRALRHSTYAVTEKYYVDSSTIATPGFL